MTPWSWSFKAPADMNPHQSQAFILDVSRGAVRAENLVHGSGQRSCSPCRSAVMITGHVPAIHVPPDHAASRVAAARPA